MKNRSIEFLVGSFVLLGLAAVLYLAIQVGSARFFGSDSYMVTASFTSASGVNPGSRVEIAGVRVGTVKEVVLDEFFYAIVTLELPNSLELDEDTVAKIKTAGLIGDRFIELRPGGGFPMEPGYMIDGQSPLDIEDLISKFIGGSIDEKSE
jgi:phospholipid/cholesterol/gamma-HCH transport system substrate-binding protein